MQVSNKDASTGLVTQLTSIKDSKPPIAKKTAAGSACARTELDEALEEFSRVAEEEAEELNKNDESSISLPQLHPTQTNTEAKFDPKKPRRGRPPRWLKEQTLQMGAQVRKRTETQEVTSTGSQSIDLNKSQTMKLEEVSEETEAQPDENQTQLVNEVFKKYPDLFKSNKAVKVKILTKDPTGKTVTKFITLKSQPDGSGTKAPDDSSPYRSESPLPVSVGGFKPVQKVMYTGKRGRPKKVKPGDFDPHQEERRKIEARLKRDYPQLASQLTTRTDIDLAGVLNMQDENNVQINSEENEIKGEQINSPDAGTQLNLSQEAASDDNSIEPATSNDSTYLQPSELSGGVTQYQSGQTFVMDPSQIQLVGGGGQILSLDPSHQSQDLIQLLSADGQIQFAVPKSKLTGGNISLPVQTLGVINPQPAIVNPVVGLSGQKTMAAQQVMAVGVGPMGSLSPSQASLMIPPGVMTLAPVQTYPQNTVVSLPSNIIPVSSGLIQPQTYTPQSSSDGTETSPRVVHKIVSDWDSDEENQ